MTQPSTLPPSRPCAGDPRARGASARSRDSCSTCAPFCRCRPWPSSPRTRTTASDRSAGSPTRTCAPRSSVPCRASCARGPLLLPRVEAWQAAPELVDAMAAELGRGGGAQGVGDAPSGVADRLPGAGRVRQPARRAGRGVARPAAPAREGAAADRRGARRPRGDLAGADQPARGRGPPRPRRAQAEAGGGGDLGLARPGRGVRARGRARRRHLAAAPARCSRDSTRARGEVRTAATVHCPDELAAQLASLDSNAFGHVARTRAPVLRSGADAAPLGSVDARSDRARPAAVRRAHRRARGARTASGRTSSSCS